MPRYRFALLLAIAALAASTARGADPKGLTPREKGDLAIQARAVLKKYCSECHGEKPKRSQLSVSEYSQVVAEDVPVPFVAPGNPDGSQIVQFIEDGSMLFCNGDAPTEKELEALKAWIKTQAPSYPKTFDERSTLAVMLDDFDRQDPKVAPFIRYLSVTHLVPDGGEPPNLVAVEKKLQDAFLAASGKKITPVPVNDTATVYRFDIRDVGWDTRDLFDRMERRQPAGRHPTTIPFDLILLEYPHPFALAEDDPLAARLRKFFTAARQPRPVPFLRADWLGDVLAKGKPLAADLNSLIQLSEVLAKKGEACGPLGRPFANAQAVKSAFPPFSAIYSGDCSKEEAPFKLEFDVVDENQKVKPNRKVVVDEPFKLRVLADREVSFILLNVLADGELRLQPVAGGTKLKAGEPRFLHPENSESFSVSSILSGKDSATEYFILIASTGELPVPTLIRSRHADSFECREKGHAPVWRFVFDHTGPGEAFDPSRAVRKVIPLTITAK